MCDDIANNRNTDTSQVLEECGECGRLHVKGHNPHEKKPYVAPVKRKPTKHPSLTDMGGPSAAVLRMRAERKAAESEAEKRRAEMPAVALPVPAPVAGYPRASEVLSKPINPAALPCEVCGSDVTIEGSEKITRRRAYCAEHYEQTHKKELSLVEKSELSKEITVDKQAKRIIIEVDGAKITIER
jgi:hypothetical protein